MSEQKALLENPLRREVFDLIKDDSSSLVAIADTTSRQSSSTISTQQSSQASKKFQFDAELLGSEVYQRAIRSLVRQPRLAEKTQRAAFTPKRACRILLLGARDGGKEDVIKHIKLSPQNCQHTTETLSYRLTIRSALVALIRTFLISQKADQELPVDKADPYASLVLRQELPIDAMNPELLTAVENVGARLNRILAIRRRSRPLFSLEQPTL